MSKADSVHVRLAQTSDETPLLELVRLFPTPDPPPGAAYTTAFHQKLTDENSFLAVAEHSSTLVGYVSGYCHPTFYARGPTAWIDELFVIEQFRQLGIGRALMNAFELWATQRGCKLVSLATARAGTFYERLGYATKAGYYKKYLGSH